MTAINSVVEDQGEFVQAFRVVNGAKIEIQFKSGIVMTQRIDFED